MTDKKAIEVAKSLSEFCKEQNSCQNCVFRKHGADAWKCHFEEYLPWLDLQDIESNYNAKKKNHGYI